MANLIPYRYRRNGLTRPDHLFGDDFFRSFFAPFAQETLSGGFRVDVRDMGDRFLMEADLPGVKRDQVKIEVDDGVLTIRAEMDNTKQEERDNYVMCERRYGKMQRSFNVSGVVESDITAEFTDGVLKLSLPKLTEQPKSGRNIEIQ
jgi:HSP20 family protein